MHATGRQDVLSFLISGVFFSLYSYTGADYHSVFRAHYVHRTIPHAHSQRAKTSVPHWPGVHFVGVFDIHSVRVPEEEVINSW